MGRRGCRTIDGAEYRVNPGFEEASADTGSGSAAWAMSITGSHFDFRRDITPGNAHSGSASEFLEVATVAGSPSLLVLNQPTTGAASVTPGADYTLSFWAKGDLGQGGKLIPSVDFLDASNQAVGSSTVLPAATGITPTYQQFTYHIGPAPAGSDHALVGLALNASSSVLHDASNVHIDDVVLAPEPVGLALIGVMLLGTFARPPRATRRGGGEQGHGRR